MSIESIKNSWNSWNKKQKIVVLAIVLLIIFLIAFGQKNETSATPEPVVEAEAPILEAVAATPADDSVSLHKLALMCTGAINGTSNAAANTNSPNAADLKRSAQIMYYVSYITGRKIGMGHDEASSEGINQMKTYMSPLDSGDEAVQKAFIEQHQANMGECNNALLNNKLLKEIYSAVSTEDLPSNKGNLDALLEKYAGIKDTKAASSTTQTQNTSNTDDGLQKLDSTWGQDGWAKCAATFVHVSAVFVMDSSVTDEQKQNLDTVSNFAGKYRQRLLARGIPDEILGRSLKMWSQSLTSQGESAYASAYNQCNADLTSAFSH